MRDEMVPMKISRRTFVRTVGTMMATGPWVLRHWTEAWAQEPTLVVCTWGGLYQKAHLAAFARPFEKETGIKVRYVVGPSTAKMKAQVETGNIEWDLVDTQALQFYRGVRENLFEPVDYRAVDKTHVDPGVVHSHGIGSTYYAQVIGYSLKTYTREDHPRTWADFFDDKKYPGTRTLPNYGYRVLDSALLADGVPPEKLYPLDIDRALRKMEPIKNRVIWWATGANSSDILARGEADLGHMTNGNVDFAKQKGGKVEIEWGGPALLGAEMWCVLRGTAKKDLAMKYINFALRAEAQAALAKLEPYGPVNKKAFDYIPEEVAQQLPSVPGRVEHLVSLNDQWWGENEAVAIEKYNAWRIKA